MKYSEYAGIKWGELSQDEKDFLLNDAVCRGGMTLSPLTDGEGMVQFAETLATYGIVQNGVISIEEESELYNPCIGENGNPLSEEELDELFEEYECGLPSEEEYNDFEYLMKSRPHVVLLGAGASVATILKGDKNGKKISAMKGFIDTLGMQDIISGINLSTDSDNLEDIYMEMYERDDCKEQRELLEVAIEKYFSEFELPDEPTVYDFLILSLTRKDLIATFNWDPLLLQAYKRCMKITDNLPQLVFLHGNVEIAICEMDFVVGYRGQLCPRCKKELSKVPLLYPIREKNYESIPYIKSSWTELIKYLKKAYRMTVFGYSAPKSDNVAVEMLKMAWGLIEDRNLEEIEIIDICPEEVVRKSWEEFIHTHHYNVYASFFDSALGRFPRRTCELLFDNTLGCRWIDGKGKGFKDGMSFVEIKNLLEPLLNDENRNKGKVLIDPYI